jgi:hypothetical protein
VRKAGDGGESYYGPGGMGPARTSQGTNVGVNADNYGAGGSGAINLNNSNNFVGGTGMQGVIDVIEFLK